MHLRQALIVTGLALASAAQAVPSIFVANLNGPSEEPPNTSPGTGITYVTIDPDAHTMRVVVNFSGLLGTVTASHIHVINGPDDLNTSDTVGPVATPVPTFPGFPSGVTAGFYDVTFDMTLASSYRAGFLSANGGTAASAEAALFGAIIDGRAYLNIHTGQFPGGEIRGFLSPVPGPAAVLAFAVPAARALRRRRRARRSS